MRGQLSTSHRTSISGSSTFRKKPCECLKHLPYVDTWQAVEAELAAVRARTVAALQHANSGKTAFLKLLNLQVRPLVSQL